MEHFVQTIMSHAKTDQAVANTLFAGQHAWASEKRLGSAQEGGGSANSIETMAQMVDKAARATASDARFLAQPQTCRGTQTARLFPCCCQRKQRQRPHVEGRCGALPSRPTLVVSGCGARGRRGGVGRFSACGYATGQLAETGQVSCGSARLGDGVVGGLVFGEQTPHCSLTSFRGTLPSSAKR